MIEKIDRNGFTLAIIVRSGFKADGVQFFTPLEAPQQMGYMNRAKGHVINVHKHDQIDTVITRTYETLIVRSGKLKVSLYDQQDNFAEERILQQGDIILLSGYGHGFEMLEDAELIEIKQGPFIADHKVTMNVQRKTASDET